MIPPSPYKPTSRSYHLSVSQSKSSVILERQPTSGISEGKKEKQIMGHRLQLQHWKETEKEKFYFVVWI